MQRPAAPGNSRTSRQGWAVIGPWRDSTVLNQAAGTEAKASQMSPEDDLGHKSPRGSEPELGPPPNSFQVEEPLVLGPGQAGRSWLQDQRFGRRWGVPSAGGQCLSSWLSRPFPRDSEMGTLPPVPHRKARASQGYTEAVGAGDPAGQGGAGSTRKAGECFLPGHPAHAHPASALTPWQGACLKSSCEVLLLGGCPWERGPPA